MTRRLLVVSAALAFILALWALWAFQAGRKKRAANLSTARTAVLEYLRALEAHDEEGVAKLVPEDYDTADAVGDRLRRFGGVRSAEAEIQIGTDISPEVYVVKIRAIGADGVRITWTENLFWRDGAWRLVLGAARRGLPAGIPPASTERPAS